MGPAGESGQRGTRPLRRTHTAAPTAMGWAVGLAVTATILGTPYLLFGYRSPAMHLVLGTLDACVALLVAYLVFGRFLRSRLLQDLLLAQGLLLLAAAGLGLVLLLHLFALPQARTFDVWLPLTLRALGALLVAAASVAGSWRTVEPRHWGRRWGSVLPWAVTVLATAVLWALRTHLPVALEPSPPPSAEHPVIVGHPLLLAVQGFSAVCFLLASLAFTVRAVRRDDELLRWLGPACALAGFARANYVLFPSLYSDWIYTGDLLRTGAYLVLLVGAGREIRRYWSEQARAAVMEDRRRLARELHDGVVQELAYIRAESRVLPLETEGSQRILAACDRALDEARAAVDALGRSDDEPLGHVLRRAAQQVADRYGARLDVDLDDCVAVDQEQRHALVRIAREAVLNAVRHGGADRIRLRLVRDGAGHRLVVQDDGRGFDVEAATHGTGYGLTSMRERAQALPGSFEVRSEPERGTTVGVSWSCPRRAAAGRTRTGG